MLLLLLAAGPVLVIKDHFAVLRRVQGERIRGPWRWHFGLRLSFAGAVVGGLLGSPTMVPPRMAGHVGGMFAHSASRTAEENTWRYRTYDVLRRVRPG